VWDKVTGIKNPQGILDMPNKENYHVKDLALKSVPIHQWNPATGKYADITAQVLNGETPTTTPTVTADNWMPFADGFDIPFSGSPTQSQNYLDFLGVYGGTTYDGYHPGEDWKVPFNGSVFSIANGKVERVGSSTGLGYYLVIRHQLAGDSDSFYSVFYHVKKPLVSKNENVYRGQKVAVIGDFDVPVHLHFELRNFLPTNLYASDNTQGLGYYGHGVSDGKGDFYGTDDLKLAAEKIMLKDGFFIAPSTFVSENAPSSVSSDVSALMKTYQTAGIVNKALNQYYVEKRGQFIAILIRAIEARAHKTLASAANLPYTDVPANSGIRPSLLKACELKILAACAGVAQTKFNPDSPISRQEALTLTVRAYEALKLPIVFDATKANTFVDVPETNAFNQTAVKGFQATLTSGVMDGTYRYFYPARWVQRGEAVSFVEKLIIQLNAK
jgi:Peptidase family M23